MAAGVLVAARLAACVTRMASKPASRNRQPPARRTAAGFLHGFDNVFISVFLMVLPFRRRSRVTQPEEQIAGWPADVDEIVRAVVGNGLRWRHPICGGQVTVLLQIPAGGGIRPGYDNGIGSRQGNSRLGDLELGDKAGPISLVVVVHELNRDASSEQIGRASCRERG